MRQVRTVIGAALGMLVGASALSAQEDWDPNVSGCGYTYAIEITNVEKSPDTNRYDVGDTIRVSAVSYRYGGSECSGLTEILNWSSSNENVADLLNSTAYQGVYVIRAAGAVTLRATGYSSSPPAPYAEVTLNIQLAAPRPPCYNGTWHHC